jgi:hypothetical protein
MLALKPYWGKPAVRDFRGGDGNVGIIRSPVRAIVLLDRTAYLNLGTAQTKLGQHKAAAGTFQRMLTLNIADMCFRHVRLLRMATRTGVIPIARIAV